LDDIDWDLFRNFLTPVDGGVSEQCYNDSIAYLTALNNPSTMLTGNGWAYKMFDANPLLLPPGFFQGYFKHLGAFDSCLEVTAPSFKGQHCFINFQSMEFPPPEGAREIKSFAHLDHHLRQYQTKLVGSKESRIAGMADLVPLLSFGRCIPDSCTAKDLQTSLIYYLLKNNITSTPYVLNCHTADESVPLDDADWGMIGVIGFFALLITIGTFIDVTLKYLQVKFYPEKLIQLFQGFSLYSNTVKLFKTDNVRPDSLTSINGIRFLSMTWVLFSHAYSSFTQTLAVTNFGEAMSSDGPIYGSVAFQAILNGFPSVDSFFFIGSTLLAYITLKELDKTRGGNPKFWIMFYVHRYIRLTGVYAIAIGFTATLLRQFATGPQSYTVSMDPGYCQESWWINLLYINNLVPQWDMYQPWCLGQAWYLANDMQYFIISPIFIYALWKSPKIGLALSFAGLLAGTVAPMVIVYQKDLELSPSFPNILSDPYTYMLEFYIVPWCRFQPYICGIIFGYLLHRMRDTPRLPINKYNLIWIWAVVGAIGALVVYGLAGYVDEYMEAHGMITVGSMAARVSYNGLHRLAWSICLGWVILACTKGAAGPINTILSWRAWVPLARLSYCIYLVHMIIIAYVTANLTFSVTFSHTLGIYWILANLCFSIPVAYIFSMGFEIPISHLERVLFAQIGIGKLPAANKYNSN